MNEDIIHLHGGGFSRRSIMEQYLQRLQELRTEADKRNDKAVVASLDNEIEHLKKVLI